MSSSRTLQITYVGMKSQDVPIKSGTIKVMMKSDSEVLQEVVVTGMQKMDKRLFTGATKQLNADNVKLDGLPDISRGLEGRAAGVSVQNVSGTFGTAPKIRVRGATSIYGSSKPLWVVDGVILVRSRGLGDMYKRQPLRKDVPESARSVIRASSPPVLSPATKNSIS